MKLAQIIVIFALGFLVFAPKSFASTLHLSPATAKVGLNGTTTITVRLSTAGEPVNGVSAYLSYPSDIVEVAGISYGSSFGIAAEGSSGGGAVRISRGSLTGVNGTITVASIRFKGKKNGTAKISFTSGSAAPKASDSSDSLSLGASTGASITVDSTIKATDTDASADKKAPVISDLKVTEIATNSAIITWKTDELSDSSVEYGLDKGRYVVTDSLVPLVIDHKMTLLNGLFIPGSTIHFQAKSKDKAGNTGVSSDTQVQLKGYTVVLSITDEKGIPIQNAEVTLYENGDKTSQSTTDGKITFLNLAPGNHVVVVTVDGGKTTQNITVTESDKPQNIPVQVAGISTFNPLIAWIIGIAVVVLALGALFFMKKHGTGKEEAVVVKTPETPETPVASPLASENKTIT